MDAANTPSVESISEDLREIVRDGIQRFSMEKLKALPILDGLRPQAGHSPNVLSIKAALVRHVLHLEPDWKCESALALLGLTEETRSADLPRRREVAGLQWNPAVTGNTFRARGNGESRIINEVAAALNRDQVRSDEHVLDAEHPVHDQVRSHVSIEFELRLGYRWTRYRRTVRWDETAQKWHNVLILEIEALRPGTRIIEYDYVGPKLVIVGAPTVEPEGRPPCRPSYLSSVGSGFHSGGYYRARFDVGRELFANERVTLTFSYYLPKLGTSHQLVPEFGVVTPFDCMELIELAFVPIYPERSLVSAYRHYLLGSIVVRRWDSLVVEDRLSDGNYTGVFTFPSAQPFAGVTYSMELTEMSKMSVRNLLAENGIV